MISIILAAAIAGLGSPPVSTNANVWLRASDYPRNDNGSIASKDAKIELTVDTSGRVIACRVVNATARNPIDNIFCQIPLARAHFTAALDEQGRPIVGIFVRNFYSRFDQHSHGPVWTDYELAVRGIAIKSTTTSVLRIVVDNRGQVESCVPQMSSGSLNLDSLACSYTSKMQFPPVMDDANIPVRALRMATVGFTSASQP